MSAPQEDEDHEAVGVLVSGADDSLVALGTRRRAAALKTLALRTRQHMAARAVMGRPPDEYELRTLAWTALRVASLADGKAAADRRMRGTHTVSIGSSAADGSDASDATDVTDVTDLGETVGDPLLKSSSTMSHIGMTI